MKSVLPTVMSVLFRFYRKVGFKHPPSPELIQHIEKFLVFGAGMLIAQFLSIVSQIVMGRQLGPELYGRVTIILLIASYCATPIAGGWGLVFTKIAAREPDEGKKNQALKSLLLVTLCCGISTIFLLFIGQRPLAALLDIDSRSMQLSLITTIFYAWWIVTKQIAQGSQAWPAYLLIQNIWAGFVLAGVIGLILSSTATVVTVCCVFFIGYFISGLIVLKNILAALHAGTTRKYVHEILSHGKFLLLNGLIGLATLNIDRILIHKYLGAEEVGIYQAHVLSTCGIFSAFMTILITYIFPVFCRYDNMQIILGKINRAQYPGTILCSLLIGGLVIRIYGFSVSPLLFSCLCLFNALQFHVQLKTWYLASRGVNETKTTLRAHLIFLGIHVVMLKTLVQHIGIIAGGVSLLMAAGASLGYLIKKSAYSTSPYEANSKCLNT